MKSESIFSHLQKSFFGPYRSWDKTISHSHTLCEIRNMEIYLDEQLGNSWEKRRAGGGTEEEKVGREEGFAVLPFLLSRSLIYSSIFACHFLYISLFFSPHPKSIGRLSMLRFTDAFGGGGESWKWLQGERHVVNFAIEILGPGERHISQKFLNQSFYFLSSRRRYKKMVLRFASLSKFPDHSLGVNTLSASRSCRFSYTIISLFVTHLKTKVDWLPVSLYSAKKEMPYCKLVYAESALVQSVAGRRNAT